MKVSSSEILGHSVGHEIKNVLITENEEPILASTALTLQKNADKDDNAHRYESCSGWYTMT